MRSVWDSLFQLRFPGGWVWSNRPAAACRFAGLRAEADTTGWRTFGATGWFSGDNTPFAGVYAVPGGSQIRYEPAGRGRVERRTDALAAWASNPGGDALGNDRVDEVAEGLQGFARSLSRIRPGGVEIHLSGGRDSRVVAAAFLSVGVGSQVHTDADEPGEAAVAEALVAALPGGVQHRAACLFPPVPGEVSEEAGECPATLERALGWHRVREGLKWATYLPITPPDGFRYPPDVIVTGDFGEIARGHYYRANTFEEGASGEGDRTQGDFEVLASKVIRRAGVTPEAEQTAEWQMRRVVLTAAAAGLEDVRLRYYWYASERLRRWGGMMDRNDRLSPLLVPEFIRAAFDLTPEQRREDALHRAVVARLIPAWSEIPYYVRPPGLVQPSWRSRLGSAPDHAQISALIADPGAWRDAYDIQTVQREWGRLRAGEARKSAEMLLQRVVWRATFDDYLAELNGEEVPARATPAITEPQHPGPVARVRSLTARALAKAARVVDPA